MIITKEIIIEDYGLTENQFERLQAAIAKTAHSYKDIKKALGEMEIRRGLWEQSLNFLIDGKPFIFVITFVESAHA